MNKLYPAILIFLLIFSCKEKEHYDKAKKPYNVASHIANDSIEKQFSKQIDSIKAIYGDSIEIVDLSSTDVDDEEHPPPPPPPKLPPKIKKKK
ncbi:MAG TPA: hypothetical protein VMY77_10150 [Chitinophagaceae bacterium]|nr:hypothetical protein [Chitinophagaceae bacterium]